MTFKGNGVITISLRPRRLQGSFVHIYIERSVNQRELSIVTQTRSKLGNSRISRQVLHSENGSMNLMGISLRLQGKSFTPIILRVVRGRIIQRRKTKSKKTGK